jgi:hypothetical protein
MTVDLYKVALVAGAAFGLWFLVATPFGAYRYIMSSVRVHRLPKRGVFDLVLVGISLFFVGLLLYALFGLYITEWRPINPREFFGVIVVDVFFFLATIFILIPHWRDGGYSKRRIKIELLARIVFCILVASVSVYRFGAH